MLVVRALGGVGSVMFTVAAMSLIIKLSPARGLGPPNYFVSEVHAGAEASAG